jgi:FkbM family methyltransferase
LSGAENCVVFQAACGKERATSRLMIPRDDSGRAGLFHAFSGAGDHDVAEVEVCTLDEILSGYDFDALMVVKIDVEGSEVAVLEGARRTIERLRPPLLIELNPWSAAAAGKSASEVLECIEGLGYRSYQVIGSQTGPTGAKSVPLDKQVNLVVTR